jgi:hypothetical protein
MRRIFNIVLVLCAVLIKVMAPQNQTVAQTKVPKHETTSNAASISGLRVARPDNMMRFPLEVVPLP